MLDIYKASAGSGKTFALTLEYFRIIFTSPMEYRNILAVTFTNKATEEMKSRIINELHRLAEGEESDYGSLLQKELGFDGEQLRNRAVLLRTMILHDYGRLAVTTIDRFFQRMVKSFTRELGIFPGYNVELDSEYVLLKSIEKMTRRLGENPDLRSWIAELMSHSVDEGKSWSVKSKIAELGEELFRETYMLLDRPVLEKFGDRQFLKNYRAFLNTIIENYEQRQHETGLRALALIRENGLSQTDFKGGRNGCTSYFYKLAAENYDGPSATVRKSIDTPEAWYNPNAARKADIERLFPDLNLLLKEAVGLFDRDYCNYLSACQLSGNLYQLGILNDLYREVRAYCDEKGLMLLSDTTHLLNLLIAGNDASFLFEKCGNYYKHLMIDEFQDTSSMQWRNFRPLVVNSLAEGGHAMIVGDVKQSIYRWRNGEWSLLAQGVEREFRHFGVRNVTLNSNWRSAREIVGFNNTFFEASVQLLSALYAADAGEDPRIATIAEAYRGLQQIPQRQKNGYVDVTFGPEKKEEEAEHRIMEEVVAVVEDIVRRGGKQRDIVILVRSGKEGAYVADFLMEYNKTAPTPVNFISNDSLYVRSSPYVQFIVSVLKYLVEPYDMVNKATILYFYKAFVQDEKNCALHPVFCSIREDIFEWLNTGFDAGAVQALSYSLYETIETIIDKFGLKEKDTEVPYLIAFQDIIYEYESANSNSITLFLEWWEKEQEKRVLSTSEEVDAVRILTIHKSKGLEFEYVILPFCSWELDAVHPVRRIWCHNDRQGFDGLEYAPLNYSSKLADTIFREDYLDEHLKAYIDNLNLLYVALTRAKTELYVRPYTPKYNKDGSIVLTDIGAFMYEVLTHIGKDSPEAAESSFRWGQKTDLNGKATTLPSSLSLERYPVWKPDGRISVKYNFRDYTAFADAGLSAIDEGKLLHEIFKSIRYTEDVPQAVQQAYLSGLIRYDEKEKYVAKIRKYLNHPQASEWFEPHWQVVTERDILFPDGSKVRPDRVILTEDRVRVIDYKFGLNEEPRYIKQVRFYCSTLEMMGMSRVEGYIWYVKTGKVVAC